MQCFKCATPLPDGSRFCNSCGADVSGASSERTQTLDLDPQLRDKLQEEVGQDFVVGRELGRGGMAIVYEARDAHLGRKVAIKILPPELTFGRGLVERFKREARTAATLDHPNIIPIFRVSTGGRLFWYVMKYLEGESLAEHVKREGAQPLDVTVVVVEQVADALQYAHDHGVVHRDVKPANVMLDQRGWVTVTDFGIAKAASEQSMTGSGSMIGTPYYMSPEQCSGKKVTGAADQYSLGIMAYEMLSGQLPFTGDSAFDIIKQHCMDPPPPLSEVSPQVPCEMMAAVGRALSKSPEERFPSVLDFAAALREAWDANSATQGTPPEHRAFAARTARHGLPPNTPRTPRPSATLDVNALPEAPTEALTPEEPQTPAPEFEPQALAPRQPVPEPEPEEPERPEPEPQDLAPPEPLPAVLTPSELALPEPEELKPPEPAPEPQALAPPVPEPEPKELQPPAPEPQALVPPTPEPERVEPRRPIPRPMAPPRPRPAPFALVVEQQQARKLNAPVAIVAVIAIAAGLFGAWKLMSARGAPSAPIDSVAAAATPVTSGPPKAAATPSPRATRARGSAPSPAIAAAPRALVAVGGAVSFVISNLPPGAELRFDGLPVPGTSWRARAGVPHQLVLSAPGYDPWSGTYTLRANETQRIDFRRVLRRAN